MISMVLRSLLYQHCLRSKREGIQSDIATLPSYFLIPLVLLPKVIQHISGVSIIFNLSTCLFPILNQTLKSLRLLVLLCSTGNTGASEAIICSQSFPPLPQPLPTSPAASIVVAKFFSLLDSSACDNFHTFATVHSGQVWEARMVDKGTGVVKRCPKGPEAPTDLL